MTKPYQPVTLAQLKQQYEAMFGIQGPRLELLLVSEMREAIKTGVAHGRAPARGSAFYYKTVYGGTK